MKNIKVSKSLCILLVVFLLASLSACSVKEQGTADKSEKQDISTQQAPENQQNINGVTARKTADGAVEVTQTALQVWEDSIGTSWAHGAIEITNTGDVPVEIGDISISFVGNDDAVLGTASMVLPVPEIIQPGETAYAGESTFIEGISGPAEIASLEANIDFRKADGQSQNLDVQNLRIVSSEYGGPTVTGRVVNTSQANADDIRIVVAFLDENDKLLGVYTASPDVTLAPEKNMGFETSYPNIEVKDFASKVKKMIGKAYNWSFQ